MLFRGLFRKNELWTVHQGVKIKKLISEYDSNSSYSILTSSHDSSFKITGSFSIIIFGRCESAEL